MEGKHGFIERLREAKLHHLSRVDSIEIWREAKLHHLSKLGSIYCRWFNPKFHHFSTLKRGKASPRTKVGSFGTSKNHNMLYMGGGVGRGMGPSKGGGVDPTI